MQILFNPSSTPTGLAIAIGNFDGVHRGHKEIISRVKDIAREKGLKPAVITFEPHPLHLFRRELLPIRLTDLQTKAELLRRQGVEVLIVLKFNPQFAAISANEFIEKFLIGNHIITGHDFAFGKNREGNVEMLRNILRSNYTMLDAVGTDEVIYSSSGVRKALKEGDVRRANEILGHEYSVTSRIISGAGKGSQLGFATANIRFKPHLLRPRYGVYKVDTDFGRGVANFGVRPTLDGKTELLEVHIFGFDKKIYGEKLTTRFIDFIRPEKTFGSLEELKEQIRKDCETANK